MYIGNRVADCVVYGTTYVGNRRVEVLRTLFILNYWMKIREEAEEYVSNSFVQCYCSDLLSLDWHSHTIFRI